MPRDIHKAYLLQARSDFAAFELLAKEDRDEVPECHALHYLQMAAEKLAKAAFLARAVQGFNRFSHVAFSLVPQHLCRRDVAKRLGWDNFRHYREFIKSTRPLFREIDELAPAVGPQAEGGGPAEGPNVEYPWPLPDGTGGGWVAPAEHDFRLLRRLLRSSKELQALNFIRTLMERFEEVFR